MLSLCRLFPVQAISIETRLITGYPGVASLDILDNVVPYIGGEEEKMEWETSKILGDVDAHTESGFTMPKIPVLTDKVIINARSRPIVIVSPCSTDISFPSPSLFNDPLQVPTKSKRLSHPTSLKFKPLDVHRLRNARLWF